VADVMHRKGGDGICERRRLERHIRDAQTVRTTTSVGDRFETVGQVSLGMKPELASWNLSEPPVDHTRSRVMCRADESASPRTRRQHFDRLKTGGLPRSARSQSATDRSPTGRGAFRPCARDTPDRWRPHRRSMKCTAWQMANVPAVTCIIPLIMLPTAAGPRCSPEKRFRPRWCQTMSGAMRRPSVA
jgi:hypothetical protein